MNDEVTRQDYWNSIELMADEVENAIEEYDQHPSDAVWEEVDSSSWVIYNHKNLKAIEFSHSEPVEWKHMVADDASFWEIAQAYAYGCIEADLYDELRERDVEL